MNHFRINFMTLLIISISMTAIPFGFAQTSDIVVLDDLIKEVIENNPEIKARHDVFRAAEQRIKQAISLKDPKLSVGYFIKNPETRVGPQIGKYGVSQKFPFFGKLTLKGKVAQKDRDIAYEKYEAAVQEVIKNLKYSFYDLYWIRKSTDITKEIKDLLDELEKVAESKYSTGIASQQDVMKAQVEISKLIAKLYTLGEQEVTLQEKINTLLNRPVETPFGKIGNFSFTEFPYTLEKLLYLSEEYRQELKAASLNIDKHTEMVSLKKKDYFPDFTLGVDFIDVGSGKTAAFNDGQDAWMGKAAINVPIWRGRIKASVNEAKNNLSSSENIYQSVKNRVSFQLKDALFQLKTCKNLLDLYENALIPQAEESFKASQAGYENGKVDFLDLIDAERILLNFKIAYYRSVSNYEKYIADLERAVGTNVENFN
ncbi:Heavy metal RND efflux outer membrane protein, CzcC family [hydrothermal vent metagenome]|uniref:Heavy metal RND efflux outer membrane protein, CzcC family n=1 Tax=hydrothermal vent metagenome TaxID=652676 RepID=A0A3B1D5E1_9ZZZZ